MELIQLRLIMPRAAERADVYLNPLNAAMTNFSINTPLRQAAFLAQVAYESMSLRNVKEWATGSIYESRSDLGNVKEGDGSRYKGRGLIKIVGRTNYRKVGVALDLDCIRYPELLEARTNASWSSAWFWATNNLNELADIQDFEGITSQIDSKKDGMPKRIEFYKTALEVLT